MPNILTRVRRLREICGFAQEVVADKLGITQAAYSRLESGRTRLDLDRLEQICEAIRPVSARHDNEALYRVTETTDR